MPSTNSTVKDIYCPKCSARYDINDVLTLCPCGSPLLVDYDYRQAASLNLRDKLASRTGLGMWKYLELPGAPPLAVGRDLPVG